MGPHGSNLPTHRHTHTPNDGRRKTNCARDSFPNPHGGRDCCSYDRFLPFSGASLSSRGKRCVCFCLLNPRLARTFLTPSRSGGLSFRFVLCVFFTRRFHSSRGLAHLSDFSDFTDQPTPLFRFSNENRGVAEALHNAGTRAHQINSPPKLGSGSTK